MHQEKSCLKLHNPSLEHKAHRASTCKLSTVREQTSCTIKQKLVSDNIKRRRRNLLPMKSTSSKKPKKSRTYIRRSFWPKKYSGHLMSDFLSSDIIEFLQWSLAIIWLHNFKALMIEKWEHLRLMFLRFIPWTHFFFFLHVHTRGGRKIYTLIT
jgi:hypothetical protein